MWIVFGAALLILLLLVGGAVYDYVPTTTEEKQEFKPRQVTSSVRTDTASTDKRQNIQSNEKINGG